MANDNNYSAQETRESAINRMRELIKILDKAAKAYYVDGAEIMSNFEYDALYDELEELERKYDIQLSGSPTAEVGYEVQSELPKERHLKPMLSLSKTKEPDELVSFLGDNKGLLSWKMDGLTVVLTYDNGKLTKAVTRGNGEVGEIITNNVKVFKNVPLSIEFKGHLVLRGEAIIKYSDFNRINEEIPEIDAKYRNPRNLCSGSVRQLNPKITAERDVCFYAFSLVSCEDDENSSVPNFNNSRKYQYEWLKLQGFTVVDHTEVTSETLRDKIKQFESKIKDNDFPSDGLVILFDDIKYGESLGRTAKYPRDSMAFKWKDETAQTVLREIEWSASRTGLINPIAVFDEVELEGTCVSRASLHNVSYIRTLKLGIGDKIEVYKANMIIPQIAHNLTRSGNFQVPQKCPVCFGETKLVNDNDVETCICLNEHCPAKHIKKFSHFTSRDAMNIEGLSEKTIDKFIQHRILKRLPDIFHLDQYEEVIVNLEGFGRKSYDKLQEAIDVSRKTELFHMLYGMGIPGIGLAGAKLIAKTVDDPRDILNLKLEDLKKIKGIGDILAEGFVGFFKDEENICEYKDLLKEVDLSAKNSSESDEYADLTGQTFVITGSVNLFKNRSELKEFIERLNGATAGSVSQKTTYLINNDVNSTSEKNKKAIKLGVKIISEEDFMNMIKKQ